MDDKSDLAKLFDLSGQRALISGGGTGIGRQTALTFAAYGAEVVLAARRREKLEATVAELKASGAKASCVSMDITNAQSVANGLKEATLDGPITLLVNSAGVSSKTFLLDTPEEEWDQVLGTNLKGGWMLCQAVARQMIEAGVGGSIINIASILGIGSQKGAGPYMASKAGLLHLTRNMAQEWARYGIRANTVAPGYFMTDISEPYLKTKTGQAMLKKIPLRRLGNLPDLSGTMLLLASKAGAYMTGCVIVVDGGHSITQL